MRKFAALSFLAVLALTACAEPDTFYWRQTKLHPDTVPDVISAQALLEDDMAACVAETNAHNTMAALNDPVSTDMGAVVNEKGTDRDLTDLPDVYTVQDCMNKHGWTKVKHYYTIPY